MGNASLALARLFYAVPTRPDTWISYEVPDWAEKDHAKKVHGWSELDLVTFKVAGMPMMWKILNLLIVVAPKVVLWFSLTSAGFHFLMETAGIVDVTINAMAMTFILAIDEMILSCLATTATKYMLEHIEEYPPYKTHEEDIETDEEVLARFNRDETLGFHSLADRRLISLLFPRRLAFVIGLMIIFMIKYYLVNCHRQEDGSWVSNDWHVPGSLSYDPMKLFFGKEIRKE